MSRVLSAWLAVGLLALANGCTMCEHPYDYCGPVISEAGPVSGNVRAGSILSGMAPPGLDAAAVPTANAPPSAEQTADQPTKAEESPVMLYEKPVRIEGRKVDERLPDGWKGNPLKAAPATPLLLDERPK